jgi:hypothetical protein
MLDSVKISVHAPYLDDGKGNIKRMFNNQFYDILLANSDQRMNGFILNSRTGLYQTDTIYQMKVTKFDNYEMLVLNGKIKLPSYNYNVYYRIFEERIDIEFSLPKYFYGTNIFELRSHTRKSNPVSVYDSLLLGLKYFFEEVFFNVKVDWGAVEILRWDFCYNQIFQTKAESLQALKYIKMKHQSKGDRLSYETGFVQLTKTNYLKIYHKGEEFLKHDMYKLKSRNVEKYAEISQRILRYEKKHTCKNVAYFWNCNFRNYDRPFMKMEYLEQKKKGRVNKLLRAEFENVQRFTIGNSKILGCTKLDPIFFSMLYDKFRKEIKQKFTIGKMSVDPLLKEVVQPTINRTMKIKILALIKTFKSLKKAYESGAISKATYYRYKSFMEEKNMSETNIKTDIYQCWDSDRYNRLVFNSGINPTMLSKKIMF